MFWTALLTAFADTYCATLVADAPIHRLWYDLRNQSLFDSAFRAEVIEIEARREDMIWRVVERYCALRAAVPSLDSATTYVLLDGIFQRGLLLHWSDPEAAVEQARSQLDAAFAVFTAGAAQVAPPSDSSATTAPADC